MNIKLVCCMCMCMGVDYIVIAYYIIKKCQWKINREDEKNKKKKSWKSNKPQFCIKCSECQCICLFVHLCWYVCLGDIQKPFSQMRQIATVSILYQWHDLSRLPNLDSDTHILMHTITWIVSRSSFVRIACDLVS